MVQAFLDMVPYVLVLIVCFDVTVMMIAGLIAAVTVFIISNPNSDFYGRLWSAFLIIVTVSIASMALLWAVWGIITHMAS